MLPNFSSEGHVLLQAQLGGGCVERSVECRLRVQSEAWSESEMASLSFSELNVESEAAILTGRVKRVYGRLKECMMVCSAA